MASQHNAQHAFAAALFDPSGRAPADVGCHSGTLADKRFAVYRNNVVMSLTQVLEAYFPGVLRLVGAEFFRALAREFILGHPPRSPVLSRYGAQFPQFLEAFSPVADLPYLPDVARLEWLQQRAYHAADAVPLTAHDLAHVPHSDIARLCFVFHPSAQIQRSQYPIFSIWRTNTFDDVVDRIDGNAAGQAVLVSRVRLEVRTLLLTSGAYTFLAALMAGAKLQEAAEAASIEVEGFRIEPAIQALLDLDAISGAGVSCEGRAHKLYS